jgi:hypothetical protein
MTRDISSRGPHRGKRSLLKRANRRAAAQHPRSYGRRAGLVEVVERGESRLTLPVGMPAGRAELGFSVDLARRGSFLI